MIQCTSLFLDRINVSYSYIQIIWYKFSCEQIQNCISLTSFQYLFKMNHIHELVTKDIHCDKGVWPG